MQSTLQNWGNAYLANARQAVEQALQDSDPEELRYMVLAVSMHDSDWEYAQEICIRLLAG